MGAGIARRAVGLHGTAALRPSGAARRVLWSGAMKRSTGAALVFFCAIRLCACEQEPIPVGKREARCRHFCEESRSCPLADPRRVDCFTSCDDLDALNRANDCDTEFDRYYNCVERHGVCSDLDALCGEHQEAYSDCLSDPCSTDPDRDICL